MTSRRCSASLVERWMWESLVMAGASAALRGFPPLCAFAPGVSSAEDPASGSLLGKPPLPLRHVTPPHPHAFSPVSPHLCGRPPCTRWPAAGGVSPPRAQMALGACWVVWGIPQHPGSLRWGVGEGKLGDTEMSSRAGPSPTRTAIMVTSASTTSTSAPTSVRLMSAGRSW